MPRHERFALTTDFASRGAALVGMRWAAEVERNAAIAETWTPPVDFAALPRLTGAIYRAEDDG